MHSSNPNKDTSAFEREVAKQVQASMDSRGLHCANFSRFIFMSRFSWMDDPCNLNCENAVFQREIYFSDVGGTYSFRRATFKAKAVFDDVRKAVLDFADAVFEDEVRLTHFNSSPNFEGVRFERRVVFDGSRFPQGASFRRAVFLDEVSFATTEFGPQHLKGAHAKAVIADFAEAVFAKPDSVRWLRVNRRTPTQAFHVRFRNCRVEAMTFVDVHWPQNAGRLFVQDELDLATSSASSSDDEVTYRKTDHELVAVVYRQLGTSFERNRNYNLAEACFASVWEMKRRDASLRLWNRLAVNIYRVVSAYGGDFVRAFVVLAVLVAGVFPCLFALSFAHTAPGRDAVSIDWQAPPKHAHSIFEAWTDHWLLETRDFSARAAERYRRSLILSVETATFSRNPAYVATSLYGRLVIALETVLVAGQAALFLLALRRRFRH